jgi:hypothetical protein
MFATSKEMAEIVTNQQNDLIFGRRKTLYKSTIAFNSRIVDRHVFQTVLHRLKARFCM